MAHAIELVFKGEATGDLAAKFEGATVRVERGATCLVVDGRDPTAVFGALAQLDALGLELLELHRGAAPR